MWRFDGRNGSPRSRLGRCLLRGRSLLAAGLALLASSTPAFASPSLEWEAPEACPGVRELSERLSVLLGEDAGALGNGTRVRGVVSKEAAGYRVVLEVSEAERRSSRAFSAEDCADLLEASALAIALTLHEEDRTPAPPAEVPTAGVAATSPDGADAPATPRNGAVPAHVRWSAGAEGVVDFGALPAIAPGVSILGRAHLGVWSLGVHGSLFPKQRLDVEGSEQVEFGLMLVALRGCGEFFTGSTSAGVCAGFEAGQLSADGLTLDQAQQRNDPWLAPTLALEVAQLLGSAWQLLFRGETLVPLLRKQYVVNQNEPVYAPSQVDVRLSLGLSVRTN